MSKRFNQKIIYASVILASMALGASIRGYSEASALTEVDNIVKNSNNISLEAENNNYKTSGFSIDIVKEAEDANVYVPENIEDYAEANKFVGDQRVEGQYDQTSYLPLHSNFLEMRRALEKLTGTVINGDDGTGPLYKRVRFSEYTGKVIDENGAINPTANDFWSTKYSINTMKETNMVNGLIDISKSTFSDITGTEWFAQYIPVAVYYNVINGYTDGTFKGNNGVTFAEFCKMMYVTDYGLGSYVELGNGKVNIMNQFVKEFISTCGIDENSWYAGVVENYAGDNTVVNGCINDTMANSGMTRGEVADMLATVYFKDEYINEWEKLANGNVKIPFNDIKSTSTETYKFSLFSGREIIEDELEYVYSEKGKSYNMYQKAATNGVETCPLNILAALTVMSNHGIMIGDENGNSNWNKVVTRAEALVMLQRSCEDNRLSKE